MLSQESCASKKSSSLFTTVVRSILYIVVLAFCATSLALAEDTSTVSNRRAELLQPLPLDAIHWEDGFWRARLATVRNNSIPSMTALMKGDVKSHFLQNFRIASGEISGRHRGPAWNDGDCYKWVEGMAAIYAQEPDDDLLKTMDEAVAMIVKAQREDGYIHTPVLIKNRNGDDSAKPFADSQQFELYNLGHLMTAGVVHNKATGKKDLLQAGIDAADFLIRTFGGPESPIQRSAICPSHYIGLIDLGRHTGNSEYIGLVAKLIHSRDQVVEGTDDNQDRIPLRDQKIVVGHAVRANYLFAGVADLMAEMPDAQMLNVLDRLWQDVNYRKIYITGACGALYDGASPFGAANQNTISRTHQAYGYAYELPNSTAHNESCAAVGNVMWNDRMLRLTGDAKYADSMERSLYNAVLASVSLDGKRYFYTNTLRQLDQMPVDMRWPKERAEFISCYCCPPNTLRTIAEVGQYAASRTSDALWLHFYGSCTMDVKLDGDNSMKVVQRTEYPWDGKISLKIADCSSSQPFTFHLRIPGWAQTASVKINGQPFTGAMSPGSYVPISRDWKTGDEIALELPMQPRVLSANPLIEETRNQVAVQRGPIVYCLESTDLPANAKLLDVSVSTASQFQEQRDVIEGNSAVVLKTSVAIQEVSEWGDQLYRDVASDRPVRWEESRLIPYFAWGNRGKSEMSVWIPAAVKYDVE